MDCWHDEIDNANTEADLVRNAGEYLLLWVPREIPAELLGLKRMRIESREDIDRVSARLARVPAVDRPSPRTAHLRELAQYFQHAATRLGEIQRIPPRFEGRMSASL